MTYYHLYVHYILLYKTLLKIVIRNQWHSFLVVNSARALVVTLHRIPEYAAKIKPFWEGKVILK